MTDVTLPASSAAHPPASGPGRDLTALKMRQQAAWSSGNYAGVDTTLQIVGEQLCEALDLRPGSRVLDVAAGNGVASLAAARRWCEVTSTDSAPASLEIARARSAADGLTMKFMEADAEALPFEDASFEVVLSTFGVMFTPNQERAAAELLRVCKPNGKIGLANWTPESFVGQIFRTLGRHVLTPKGAKSPTLWGTRGRLIEILGSRVSLMTTEKRSFVFRYQSPEHFLEIFTTYYGPIHKAFAALDAAGQSDLRNDLYALIVRTNRASDGTVAIPSEYLEVVIVKR